MGATPTSPALVPAESVSEPPCFAPDPAPPPTFTDVPSSFWAYKHIEYAVSRNIVKGYPDGTYQPGVTLDRGQMAVFIARALVAPNGDTAIPDPAPPATFRDVPSSFWAHKWIEYIASSGQAVTQGYPDGLYHPEYACTRDQMAVYVARAFGWRCSACSPGYCGAGDPPPGEGAAAALSTGRG